MTVADRLKEFGTVILGLAAVVAMLAIGVGLLVGAARFSLWVLEWTVPASLITLLVTIVLLLVSLIPPARGFAAVGIMVGSLIFGAILWIWGLSYTYTTWGLFAVVVGLFLFGVGVVPVAMVAALVKADWPNFGLFCVAVILTFGSRGLARWLGEKADERAAYLNRADIDVKAYEVRD